MQIKLMRILAAVYLAPLTSPPQPARLFWWQGTNFHTTFDVPADQVYTSTNFLANQVFYDSLQAVTPEGVKGGFDPSNPNDYAQGNIETDGAPHFTIRLVDLSSMTILTMVGHVPSGFISEDHFGGS